MSRRSAPTAATSDAAVARRTVIGMRIGSWPRPAHVVLALAGTLAAAGLTLALTHGQSPSKPTTPTRPVSQYTVLAPADGTLRVGTVDVPQLAGACQADSCRYTPQSGHTQLPVVKVDTNTRRVQIKAAKSSTFAVSAFNTKKPSSPVSLGYAAGALLIDDAAPGTYQVSLSGDRGGIWQFTLKVAKAPKN